MGKSTLIHCISTDCSRLLSIDKGLEYVVIDELDAGFGNITSTSVSRTLVPEAIVDSTQNTWYDCPGFGDTRNETVEIATTYLIKRVIQHAKRVKVVLVIDFDSITRGHNRDGFERLLSRATHLIRNIKKYESSFSLVITKVPSYKGRYEIQDDAVKESASDFMRDHRATLHEKRSSAQKIELIDALLVQNTSYPRLSVFWRPGDVGYFNRIEKMVIGRQRIRASIIEHNSYTEIHESDFEFPLTAEAVIKVTNMSTETVDSLMGILESVKQRIQSELRQKIETAENYPQKLELIRIGKTILQREFKSSTNTELITLIVTLNALRIELHLNSIDKRELNRVEQHDNNLKMLQSLVEIEMVSLDNDLNRYLKDIIDFFNSFDNQIQTDITNEARQKIDDVASTLADVDGHLYDALKQKIDSTHGYHSRLVLLELMKRQLTSKDATRTSSLSGKIQEYRNLFNALNVTNPPTNNLSLIERHENSLNQLKIVARTDINLPIRDWIAISSNSNNLITTEFNWYALLAKIYEFLATYEVQKRTSAYNVANLGDWAQWNKPQGLTISSANFNEFIQRFTIASEFTPNESKLIEINEIVKITLKSPPTYVCNGGQTMVITGNFVKSSDIQLDKCGQMWTLKKIIVFAVDTFFVDGDLQLTEYTDIELHIFSTIFSVQQKATFHLNGKDGETQSLQNLAGAAGKPGNLGMNSGNFFALTKQIRNGELLTVQQNAGDGGNGQDGTGNNDYSVTFDESGDSITRAGVWEQSNVDQYQSDRVRDKSGNAGEISLEDNDNYINHYAVVTAAARTISNYIVHAARCCGSAGIGGPGKFD